MKISSERRYDLDWLRVLGVLLLIPFHVALIFVLQPYTIMYIKNAINSPFLAGVTGFIHMWHMPMLFIISGYATSFALNFRTAAEYVRERILRLFVPLAFGLLTFVPFTIYIQHSNAFSLQDGYARFFKIDFAHIDGMTGTFTPAHLWFILYLFIFSLAGLPIFLWLRSEKVKRVIQSFGNMMQMPLSLTLLALPLTLAAATGILGDMNPFYYFLIFLYGFIFASDRHIEQSIHQLTWIALAYGLFAGVLNVLLPVSNYVPWTLPWMILGLMYQLGRWTLTLAALGLGYRFLNRASSLLRYASEAAMPFYLLHMTFSVITGYFIVQIDTLIAIKYVLTVLIATVLTLIAYEFVRRWNVTRMLFGMKPINKNLSSVQNPIVVTDGR